jgi:putative ABC transport system permease protein
LQEVAILRTLGATRRQLFIGLLIEFATLGFLAGLLASWIASLVGYGLAVHLFDLPYHLNPELWLFGTLGGMITICLASLHRVWLASRYPPLMILRQNR